VWPLPFDRWWITGPVERIAQTLADALRCLRPARPQDDILESAVRDLRNRARLKLLIWGPGPAGGSLYRKRCEIRDRLNQLGHLAQFSEEVCTAASLASSGLNLTVMELLQAHAYDYIVCLMASPGSIGEVHDFAKSRKLAGKMMICVDQNHKRGYTAQGTLRIFEGCNGRVDWYSNPRDIDECCLATRVLEQVQKVAEAKQWVIANGGVS